MDAYEEKLTEDIQRRRAELVAKAEALQRTVATKAENMKTSFVETFDPRERLKRHPLSGLLTSLGAGMLLGGMLPGGGKANGAGRSAPASEEPSPSLLGTLAAGVVSNMVPALIPMIVGPLMSLLRPRSKKRENGRTPDPGA